MRIVLLGRRADESLENHLADSFQALGHQAYLLDTTDVWPLSHRALYWAGRFLEAFDKQLALALARKTAALHPDLVLVVYRHLHPALPDYLRKQLPGVPLVQLNPDALTNLEKGQIVAASYDYYITKDRYIADWMRQNATLNAHYLPEGFNPRRHRKPQRQKAEAETQTDTDVLVYGHIYPYRARFISHLLRAGVRVVVYGVAGPYVPPDVRRVFRPTFLSGDAKNQLVFGARIVLNTLHYAEINSVNQKYFEINGIGGFQLCDFRPIIADYSPVAPERVTYRSANEAVEKIRYFLANPNERHTLADEQYRHFQTHHTFDNRMTRLLEIVR